MHPSNSQKRPLSPAFDNISSHHYQFPRHTRFDSASNSPEFETPPEVVNTDHEPDTDWQLVREGLGWKSAPNTPQKRLKTTWEGTKPASPLKTAPPYWRPAVSLTSLTLAIAASAPLPVYIEGDTALSSPSGESTTTASSSSSVIEMVRGVLPSPVRSGNVSPSLSFVTAHSVECSPSSSFDSSQYAVQSESSPSPRGLKSVFSPDSEDTPSPRVETSEDDEAQYARPMSNPFAEVEGGWRKMQADAVAAVAPAAGVRPSATSKVQPKTSTFASGNLEAKKSFVAGAPLLSSRAESFGFDVFQPPPSSLPTKTSFGVEDLYSPSRRLDTIEASPTSPTFHPSPATVMDRPSPRFSLKPPSPALAQAARFGPAISEMPDPSTAGFSVLVNSAPGSLKARRGSNKPLSLKVPTVHSALPALGSPNSPTDADDRAMDLSETRSLPPSPRVLNSEHMGVKRDVMLGLKTNVTGGLSMKRRTSIPRLSLGGISSFTPGGSGPPSPALKLKSVKSQRGSDETGANLAVRMLGRNMERVAATPLKLSFDPVAAEGGRRELLSSQVGVGGKGHIEKPEEVEGETAEEFPYERGPREVLPGVYLGSEPNARDTDMLKRMNFGYVLNVAKEVECPWLDEAIEEEEEEVGPIAGPSTWRSDASATLPKLGLSSPGLAQSGMATSQHRRNMTHSTIPVPQETADPTAPSVRPLLIRPTASTPNLKTSFHAATAATADGATAYRSPNRNGEAARRKQSRKSDATKGYIDRAFPANSKTGRPSIRYKKLPWGHDQDDLPCEFVGAFQLIDEARSKGSNVLVHCQCGVSRSATLVIGYVMHAAAKGMEREKLGEVRGMHDAYSFVKEKSPWAGPNMGLIYQLIEYEKILSGGRSSDDGSDGDGEDFCPQPESEPSHSAASQPPKLSSQSSPSHSEDSQESAPENLPCTPESRGPALHGAAPLARRPGVSPIDEAWDALHGRRSSTPAEQVFVFGAAAVSSDLKIGSHAIVEPVVAAAAPATRRLKSAANRFSLQGLPKICTFASTPTSLVFALPTSTPPGAPFTFTSPSVPLPSMLASPAVEGRMAAANPARASVGPGVEVQPSPRKAAFGISLQTPTERRAAHRRAFSMDVSSFLRGAGGEGFGSGASGDDQGGPLE